METLFINNNLKIQNSNEESDKINIIGYCCHYNTVNLNQERVDANSFRTFFDMKDKNQIRPLVNYNHDSNYIIGGIDELTSDNTGLLMKAHINRGVKICDDMIIPNILSGTLTDLSTEGYILNGYNGIVEYEDNTYYVKDFILTAVAVTPNGADYQAKFTLANYIREYKQYKENQIKEIKSKWYLL